MRNILIPLILTALLASTAHSIPPEEKYIKLQKKIQEHKQLLLKAQRRENTVLGEIRDIDKQIDRIRKDLRKLRAKMRGTEADIKQVTNGIKETEERLDRQKGWIKRKLRTLYKFGYSRDILSLLFSVNDVSQMMRISKYIRIIARYEYGLVEDYQANLKILNEKKSELQKLKTELMGDKKNIEDKETELEDVKNFKKIILSSVRDEKTSYERMIAEMQKASKELLEIIKKSTEAEAYATTGFSRLKGKLPWPAEGTIVIPYGAQTDSRFNTPVFRNGIHIQTDPDSPVKAVHRGKVIFAEWFRGFGQLVIIDHGKGYHSLYGNLSEIFSRNGDIIKRSQVIGKSGTSGTLNGPGLYFEIRFKGKPLDPSQWLKKKQS